MAIMHYPDASPAPIAKLPLFSQWRILVQSTPGGFFALAELEFRRTVGVPDQATGGVASASTVYPGYPASLAFDNDPNTGYNGASGDVVNAWIRYDFPADRVVREVKMQPFNNAPGATYAPTAFKLQYFEAGAWVDAKVVTGLTWTAGEIKLFTI